MKEFDLTQQNSLSHYVRMRDEVKKRLQKDPDNFTDKHLLESLTDEIKRRRKDLFEKENQKLQSGL